MKQIRFNHYCFKLKNKDHVNFQITEFNLVNRKLTKQLRDDHENDHIQ